MENPRSSRRGRNVKERKRERKRESGQGRKKGRLFSFWTQATGYYDKYQLSRGFLPARHIRFSCGVGHRETRAAAFHVFYTDDVCERRSATALPLGKGQGELIRVIHDRLFPLRRTVSYANRRHVGGKIE